MVSAAGGSLQVMSLIFSSSRTYFSPLIPPLLIRIIPFMTHYIWFMDWDLCTHRGTQHPLLHLLSPILVHIFICSQTELLMGQMIVNRWGRGTNSQGSLSEDKCPWYTWPLKGMGDDTWIGFIYVPKTRPRLIQSWNTTPLCSVPHIAPRLFDI